MEFDSAYRCCPTSIANSIQEMMWSYGHLIISTMGFPILVKWLDGLMQERCNSIANTLELHLSFTNPSIFILNQDPDLCLLLLFSVRRICLKLSGTIGPLSFTSALWTVTSGYSRQHTMMVRPPPYRWVVEIEHELIWSRSLYWALWINQVFFSYYSWTYCGLGMPYMKS